MFDIKRDGERRLPLPAPVSTVLRAFWEHLTLKLVVVGIVLVAAGALSGNSIWAGLLPLWGGGLILLGTVLFVVVWRIRSPSTDREKQYAGN